MANKCFELESSKIVTDEIILNHRAYFFGSFFNGVTFLEAYINEIFANLSGEIHNPKLDELFGDNLDLIKTQAKPCYGLIRGYSVGYKLKSEKNTCKPKSAQGVPNGRKP